MEYQPRAITLLADDPQSGTLSTTQPVVLEWSPHGDGPPGGRAVELTRSPTSSDSDVEGPAEDPLRPRRPPRTTGNTVTERDLAILQWVGRHGIVTRDQITNRFFARQKGNPGKWAAYRRVRALVGLGLLHEDQTFWRQPNVLRLTTQGARFAEVDLRPARLVLAEIKHTLAVVDLVETLLASMPKTTVLITEREIRAARHRELRANSGTPSTGRMPDAELQPGGKRIAVELDLTPKRSAVYEEILSSYIRQRYNEVWWYVAPGVIDRLTQIVRRNRADDFVSVRRWEG